MIARFFVPILADRLGSKRVMAVCFLPAGLPADDSSPDSGCLGFLPLCWCLRSRFGRRVPIFPIINRQYFGNAPIGTVYGWQMLGNGLGMALGPITGGFLWDGHGRLYERRDPILSTEPGGPGFRPAPAYHLPLADSRLGTLPTTNSSFTKLALLASIEVRPFSTG